jgi:hypothetical protein
MYNAAVATYVAAAFCFDKQSGKWESGKWGQAPAGKWGQAPTNGKNA